MTMVGSEQRDHMYLYERLIPKVGIITLEDVLDELVGDLSAVGSSPDEAIVRREDGTYLVSGLLPFVDLAHASSGS
jgi:CBS domain containing-hemolysin-like protein